MPAFSEPAGEQSAPPGTTTNSFPNLGGIDEEYASLARYLELESCSRCPEHGGNQDRKDRALRSSWEDLGHELSTPDASNENRSPRELSALLPQEGSADPGEPKPLSVASPEPTDTITTLETAGGGARGREAACVLELLEARGQRTRPTTDSPAGASPDKYSPHEICSTDLESARSQSEVSDLCSPNDKTPGVLFQTRGSEPPQPPCKSAKERDSAMPPLFTSVFTWNLSQKASEGGTGKNLAAVENFTSTLVSTVRAGQETPGPSNSGGLEGKQPLRSENSSFVQLAEGGNEGPSNGGPDTTDTSARNGSGVMFPRETPTTFTAHLEGLQVARESGDTWPPVTMAPKVHPAKYLPVSIAENSLADGPKGSSPQAPDENILHLTSHAQLGHILNDSQTESLKEPSGMAPRGPGVPIHVPRLPEVEGFCSSRPLQTDNQSGDKSLTVDRADNRSLGEDFQEKESERTQRIQHESLPPQGFASEGGFQERWPMTAVAQGAIHPVPLDHLSANSREDSGQSSDLGPTVCKVAHATVEDDGQALSHTPPLSDIFLEGSRESGPGLWKAGRKLKIITLEAPISEDWLPRPQTGSECKELEAGPVIPDRVWALSDVLKAHSPQAESGPALANNRETRVSEKRASRAYWSSLSSQYLSQPRLLESSVDPVDEKELPVTDLSSETSKTGEKENVSHVSQNREENQIKDHAAFFQQFLTCPKIVESSVDPTDEAGVMVGTRAGTPGPSESTPAIIREESKLNDGNVGQRLEVQPAILQVPRPDEGGETIPSGCGISQIQEGSKRSLGEAEQSKNNKAEPVFSTSPPSNCLAVMTHASVGADSHNSTGQVHDVPENDLVEPRNRQYARSDSKEREAVESECGKPSSSGLAPLPCASSPKGNTANFSVSHTVREPQREEPHPGETTHVSTSGSPAVTSASGSGECASEKAPKILQHPCQQGSNLGCGRRTREENLGHTAAQTLRFPKAPPAGSGSEEVKKPETSGGGHLAEGVKKKILSRVAALRLRLEEKENVLKSSSFLKKIPKLETPASCTEEEKDAKKPPCKREGKGEVLLLSVVGNVWVCEPDVWCPSESSAFKVRVHWIGIGGLAVTKWWPGLYARGSQAPLASASPARLVEMQIVGLPPPEFPVQGVGSRKCVSNKFPGDLERESLNRLPVGRLKSRE